MEKKLYRVRVVLFMMAENESAASVAATQARLDIFECAIRKAENVDPEWKEAIPYNADDDRTCSEILSNKQQTTRLATRSLKLSPYANTDIRAFNVDNQPIQAGQQT